MHKRPCNSLLSFIFQDLSQRPYNITGELYKSKPIHKRPYNLTIVLYYPGHESASLQPH